MMGKRAAQHFAEMDADDSGCVTQSELDTSMKNQKDELESNDTPNQITNDTPNQITG